MITYILISVLLIALMGINHGYKAIAYYYDNKLPIPYQTMELVTTTHQCHTLVGQCHIDHREIEERPREHKEWFINEMKKNVKEDMFRKLDEGGFFIEKKADHWEHMGHPNDHFYKYTLRAFKPEENKKYNV